MCVGGQHALEEGLEGVEQGAPGGEDAEAALPRRRRQVDAELGAFLRARVIIIIIMGLEPISASEDVIGDLK